MDTWEYLDGLSTLLGAPACDYDSKLIPRSARRTMSRMSEMATLATKQALADANLTDINGPRTLISLGSTTGSPDTFEQYFTKYAKRNGPSGQLSTSFFKMMNHSVSSNVATALNYFGPQLSVSSACATSTQAAVAGWQLISSGVYDVVIAGGADELHHTSAAIFDNVHAASTNFNDRPDLAPRPFDKDRDGLVVSEGAGILILESEEHALARGAAIQGYISGGAYFCDGSHMSQPQIGGMVTTMKRALEVSQINSTDIDYVNAHGTGTKLGDYREAMATGEVFGEKTPVSSIKGHLGHSLAACGGIEIISCIKMMQENTLIPTRNLETTDPEISGINLLKHSIEGTYKNIMSNSFAFGGMNASIVIAGK